MGTEHEDEPREARFLIGSGDLEELAAQLDAADDERDAEAPADEDSE